MKSVDDLLLFWYVIIKHINSPFRNNSFALRFFNQIFEILEKAESFRLEIQTEAVDVITQLVCVVVSCFENLKTR